MRVFATTEHEGQLDLVSLAEKVLQVIHLGLVVVFPDVRAELDLFDCVALLAFSCQPFFSPLFVPELAEIHDPADRRIRLGGDLDQVESPLGRESAGAARVDDAHHRSVGIDTPHLGNPDLVVGPNE